MIMRIGRFLALLAIYVLTCLLFTSVANRHCHRSIHTCGHRSSRPHIEPFTDIGLFPVYFRLLALPGTMALCIGLLLATMLFAGFLGTIDTMVNWHQLSQSPVAIMALVCWEKCSQSAAMVALLATIIILFSKLKNKSGEVGISATSVSGFRSLYGFSVARAGHSSIQNLSLFLVLICYIDIRLVHDTIPMLIVLDTYNLQKGIIRWLTINTLENVTTAVIE